MIALPKKAYIFQNRKKSTPDDIMFDSHRLKNIVSQTEVYKYFYLSINIDKQCLVNKLHNDILKCLFMRCYN